MSHHPRRLRLPLLALLVFAALLVTAAATARDNAPNELLSEASLVRSEGVHCAECLTDGRVGREGDFWKTTLTARFGDDESFVLFDLGGSRHIAAVWLQADNNDTYLVEGSDDGVHFTELWSAWPVAEAGLRSRQFEELDAAARFVRLRVAGGDDAYGISEVQLFSAVPSTLPAGVVRGSGTPLDVELRTKTLLFGAALIAWLFLTARSVPWWWVIATATVPVWGAYEWLSMLDAAWPPGSREVSLARGVVAVVAGFAVAREAFAPRHFAAHRAVVLTTLLVCAATSMVAFYNLGHPQFFDQRAGRRTFVHYWDLRQYYPTAKYFPEIGYRGMYEADVAAYLEDQPDADLDSLGKLPMRDLGDLQMRTVAGERSKTEHIKENFSPERWEEYKHDARILRDTMGTQPYLRTMQDMGGNATPFWIGIAYVLFNAIEPGETAFLLTGLIDPLLLLGMFAAVWRLFGVRTMLVAMVVFGANDFIMYGTNWGGATLRHDWMAYLGFAACALKARRWRLAGFFLALSSMIRAFPALAVAACALPMLWWVYDYRKTHGKLPTLAEVRKEHKPTERVYQGVAVAGIALLAFSIVLLPAESWVDWLWKVRQLTSDPHANHLSLRNLIAGFGGNQSQLVHARLPLLVAAMGGFVFLVVRSARGRPLHQAMLLGLPLIPIFFYPANYYSHFVFLLPLLVLEEREADRPLAPVDAILCLLLLGMCGVQYFTVLVEDRGLHFYLESAVLVSTLSAVLLWTWQRDRLAAAWRAASAALATEPPRSP